MKSERRKGLALVISAPSGCGKTTVVNALLAKSRRFVRSISATTRKQRPGEIPGKDYLFLTRGEFLDSRRKNRFLESAAVFGNYYGTPGNAVRKEIGRGHHVILAIDVDGAAQVRKKIRCVSIFLMPPSMEALEKRLRGRRSDSAADIRRRLARAKYEMSCAKDYDYLVVNQDVDRAVNEIRAIVRRAASGRY